VYASSIKASNACHETRDSSYNCWLWKNEQVHFSTLFVSTKIANCCTSTSDAPKSQNNSPHTATWGNRWEREKRKDHKCSLQVQDSSYWVQC
jgi:hypothetical protein